MNIDISFSLYDSTPLCEIMSRQGSDKGAPNSTGHHNYTIYYYNLFRPTNISKCSFAADRFTFQATICGAKPRKLPL
jgi:hypothetical protein